MLQRQEDKQRLFTLRLELLLLHMALYKQLEGVLEELEQEQQ